MTQFEKIKNDILQCESEIEMVGLLDGINAAATVWCNTNMQDEVDLTKNISSITIYGMVSFLESKI